MPRQRVGRLDTVANWRRELSRLYRKMRSGEIPADIGTKLAYVAGVAAKLVQIEQELAEAKRIADALEQHRNPIARLDLASEAPPLRANGHAADAIDDERQDDVTVRRQPPSLGQE